MDIITIQNEYRTLIGRGDSRLRSKAEAGDVTSPVIECRHAPLKGRVGEAVPRMWARGLFVETNKKYNNERKTIRNRDDA